MCRWRPTRRLSVRDLIRRSGTSEVRGRAAPDVRALDGARRILRRMNQSLRMPPYNLLIHSAPLHESAAADFYHWHVEIIPTLTKVAGFEWATGFYLNPTSPEEAAQVLRDARV